MFTASVVIMSSTSFYEPEENEGASDLDDQNPSLSPLYSGPCKDSTPENGHGSSRSQSRTSLKLRSRLRAIRRKKPAKASIAGYDEIFNEVTQGVLSGASLDSGHGHATSQHGIVTWSVKEKETFFAMLERKGKNEIRSIAQAIGSKSELEVQEYISLLHKGLEYQHLQDRHSRAIKYSDIPASLEISEECCESLNEFAEYLSLRQENSEDLAGRRKHGDFWIVCREKAEEIDDQIESGVLTTKNSNIFLAASLLNVSKWINLSERFFMNFGGSKFDDNWINLAYKDESPSLTSDALTDFYALAVSATRRLVQSAIFIALSRMRSNTHQKAKIVRAGDVIAALDVVKMKHNGFEHWIGLPRRCNLVVADMRNKKGWKTTYMGYNEVEDVLSRTRTPSTEIGSSRRPKHQVDASIENDPLKGDDDGMSDISSPSSQIQSSCASTSEEESCSDPENAYADFLDQQTSRAEELEIWRRLNCTPPFLQPTEGTATSNPTPPLKPISRGKSQHDLVDWRDRTLFCSEWEEYARGVHKLEDNLEINRKKRRRIEVRRPTPEIYHKIKVIASESEYESEHVGAIDVEMDMDADSNVESQDTSHNMSSKSQ